MTRELLSQKFWSHGTYLGYPRAIGAMQMVLGFFGMVFLFTYGMVYTMPYSNPLDKKVAPTCASADMCLIY